MTPITELEARVTALEAIVKIIALPTWLTWPQEVRSGNIEALEYMARTGDDFFTNKDQCQMLSIELRKWVDVLKETASLIDKRVPESV